MTNTLRWEGRRKQATETTYQSDQIVDLTDKDFKVVIINMFNKVKETMIKELKEEIMIMSHQIENTNKEIEITQKNQMEILELCLWQLIFYKGAKTIQWGKHIFFKNGAGITG